MDDNSHTHTCTHAHTETQIHTDAHTHTQTDRHTQRDTKTHRTHKHTHTHAHTNTKHTEIQTSTLECIYTVHTCTQAKAKPTSGPSLGCLCTLNKRQLNLAQENSPGAGLEQLTERDIDTKEHTHTRTHPHRQTHTDTLLLGRYIVIKYSIH